MIARVLALAWLGLAGPGWPRLGWGLLQGCDREYGAIGSMAKRIARTYKFDADLIARLDELAQRLDVPPGPLVALILARGIDAIDSGAWPLARRASAFRPAWPPDPPG